MASSRGGSAITNGGGLSVIIAGATGNTGSELVTRLVSHTSVTRIVALTRHDISVDRWRHYFPNLRTTDALKYLSIVAVDWDRIHHDASGIPAAALCAQPGLVEEGMMTTMDSHSNDLMASLQRQQQRNGSGKGLGRLFGRRSPAAVGGGRGAAVGANSPSDARMIDGHALGSHDTFGIVDTHGGDGGGATLTAAGDGGEREGPIISGAAAPAVRSRDQRAANVERERLLASERRGLRRRQSLRKNRDSILVSPFSSSHRQHHHHHHHHTDSNLLALANSNSFHSPNNGLFGGGGDAHPMWSSSSSSNPLAQRVDSASPPHIALLDSNPFISSAHRITLAQRNAIQAICQDPYYRSVFGGHTIAINCLGSHNGYMGRRGVTTVDLEYSMSFAKLVRLFNCMSVTDASLHDATVPSAEDTLRAYGVRRSLVREGHEEWAEIRSACFGRIVNVGFNTNANTSAAPNTNSAAPSSIRAGAKGSETRTAAASVTASTAVTATAATSSADAASASSASDPTAEMDAAVAADYDVGCPDPSDDEAAAAAYLLSSANDDEMAYHSSDLGWSSANATASTTTSSAASATPPPTPTTWSGGRRSGAIVDNAALHHTDGASNANSSSNSSTSSGGLSLSTRAVERAAAANAARQRKREYEARRADAAQLRLWDNAIERSLKGRRHTVHTLHHFVQVSASGASEYSPLPYFRVHGLCDRKVLGLYDYDYEASRGGRRRRRGWWAGSGGGSWLSRWRREGSHGQDDRDDGKAASSSSSSCSSSSLSSPLRPCAKVPAVPLLPKLSLLAPTLNHRADVSIFRPGLLRRRNATLLERMMGVFSPPMCVAEFADVIVDDIMCKQEQIAEGVRAVAALQAALNRKYRYKVWVTREVGIFNNSFSHSLSSMPASSGYAANSNSNGDPYDWLSSESYAPSVDGLTTSSASAAASASSGARRSSSSTTTTTTTPAVSRARLIEAAAKERAEIKSRLGVSTADLQRLEEEAAEILSGGASGRGGGGGSVGGDASGGVASSTLAVGRGASVPACIVCDTRSRLGVTPGAAIVNASAIRRRNMYLSGDCQMEFTQQQQQSASGGGETSGASAGAGFFSGVFASARRAQSPTTTTPSPSSRSTSSSPSKDSPYRLDVPPCQEPFCHQS